MTLALALMISMVVELLSALTLMAVTARLQLAGNRRTGVEAELALASAIADFRVLHATQLNQIPPHGSEVLPPTTLPGGWQAAAIAERPDSQEIVVLRVHVRRVDGVGHLVAGRQGTLLLSARTADTAIVIGHWPRF